MSAPGTFCMPSLGADMDEGRLIEWLVKPGDVVKRGDLIVVVATSKANVEVEVWEDAVVEELCVQPGAVVPVGTVLARLRTVVAQQQAAPASPTPPPPPPSSSLPAPAPAPAAPIEPAPRPAPAEPGARASPHARRRARELGVDLRTVTGSGPGGTIRAEDVEQAARTPAPKPAQDDLAARQQAMREAIARAMARSKREIPHYYLTTDVDLTDALEWLQQQNAARSLEERILPAAMILKAVAVAVADVPEVNGFFVDGAFQPGAGVHLGVAVSMRGGGLIAPALLDVQDKPLGALMADLRDLVDRARQGRLRGREVTAPTLTVTNLGDQGVTSVLGVIYPPQVALVGVGKLELRPWVVGDEVLRRSMLTLSLAGDHRASDGHRGGRFLAAVAKLLRRPEAL